ncbi:MAG: VOC family protein [Fimbriimonadaceae bacterium]|nr:VOC family protein [Fimbriimonadaceae bacterium]
MVRPPFRVTEVIYYVTDLDSAIREYVDGFGMTLVEREDWGFALVEMRPGFLIGLMENKHSDAEAGQLAPPRIGVQTSDLAKMRDFLSKAGFKMSSILGPEGGTQAMNAFDSSGNALFFWADGTEISGESE